MPRNQGTSRKGKPGRHERAVGMGRALQRAAGGGGQRSRNDGKNRRGEGGGMAMQPGVESIGVRDDGHGNTRSILEMQDIDDFLVQAEMANREFEVNREGVVVLDPTTQRYRPPSVQWGDQRTDFVFHELSVPRRPAWDEATTPEELEIKERQAFLEWRRAIAAREEELLRRAGAPATVTPFEKNLEVWRQLWRVLERSSCLLQLVDARNPLFYLSDDLRDYAQSLGRPMMVLLNKSDFLSSQQRAHWRDYLTERGWDCVFFSAVTEQQKLDAAAQRRRREERLLDHQLTTPPLSREDESSEDEDQKGEESGRENTGEVSADGLGVDVPLTREQLMETMLAFAEKHNCQPDPRFDNRIQFGTVGFPNVGKSSVINVLVGSSRHSHGAVRVAVASQPGKTKHFQTLLLPDQPDMMLCDCPGLVFPSFVSNTADLIAAGVYPIAQMRDHWPVIDLICQRIPREIIGAQYGIQLPVPSRQEMLERGLTDVPPPTAEEFLGTYCVARGMLAAASGVPDYQRAARLVTKDYAEGKLLYCHPPPGLDDVTSFYNETIVTALHNTEKLEEKLRRQQANTEKKEHRKNDETNGDCPDPIDFVDNDLLELVGGSPSQMEQPNGRGKHGKNGKTPKQKWGKKDRKKRNKDPYGCHSNPDKVASGGVIMNSGRYSQAGYTRPTSYPVGR